MSAAEVKLLAYSSLTGLMGVDLVPRLIGAAANSRNLSALSRRSRALNRFLSRSSWLRRHRNPLSVGFVGGITMLLGMQLVPAWDALTGQCHAADCQFAIAEEEMVGLINVRKAVAKCPQAEIQDTLATVARQQARWAQPEFSAATQRAQVAQQAAAAGYEGQVAVSVAFGLTDPRSVMARWLEPGTSGVVKSQLQQCGWRSVGVAYAARSTTTHLRPGVWIVIFGDQ
jgi:hypothetical protein